MAKRLVGDNEGKAKGSKGGGDNDEGDGQRRGQGQQGDGNGDKGAGERMATATKRAIATKTRLGGAGSSNDQPLHAKEQ
jgi:hypothetical protein